MIDLHAHYLPATDDGPRDMDQSLAMARLAVADGITDVTVTPHHLNGRYVTNAATIRRALPTLQGAVAEAGIELRFHAGAEVHITPELPQGLADGSAMTVADRGCAVLVEPPANNLPVGSEAILSECLVQGITPIIAHPERCLALQRDIAPLRRWVEMGCVAQLTAQSLTGRFGSAAQAAGAAMLRGGAAHVIASDGHRPYGRTPCMAEARGAVAAWLGDAVADAMTETVPAALLAGDPPPADRVRRLIEAALPERQARHDAWWRRFFGRARR